MAACGGVRRRPLPPEGREGANANVAPPPCAPSWEREDAGRRAAPDRAARQGRLGGRGSPSGPCRIKRNSSARCEAPPAWRGGRGSSPYATWLRSAAAAAVVPTSSLPPPPRRRHSRPRGCGRARYNGVQGALQPRIDSRDCGSGGGGGRHPLQGPARPAAHVFLVQGACAAHGLAAVVQE